MCNRAEPNLDFPRALENHVPATGDEYGPHKSPTEGVEQPILGQSCSKLCAAQAQDVGVFPAAQLTAQGETCNLSLSSQSVKQVHEVRHCKGTPWLLYSLVGSPWATEQPDHCKEVTRLSVIPEKHEHSRWHQEDFIASYEFEDVLLVSI